MKVKMLVTVQPESLYRAKCPKAVAQKDSTTDYHLCPPCSSGRPESGYCSGLRRTLWCWARRAALVYSGQKEGLGPDHITKQDCLRWLFPGCGSGKQFSKAGRSHAFGDTCLHIGYASCGMWSLSDVGSATLSSTLLFHSHCFNSALQPAA